MCKSGSFLSGKIGWFTVRASYWGYSGKTGDLIAGFIAGGVEKIGSGLLSTSERVFGIA